MSALIHDINQENKKFVSVIAGACEILVTQRETRNKYQTNRSIKTWATYFLLKSLTASGVIRDWTKQKGSILSYCKMTENCFRARLRELEDLRLIRLQKNRSIRLISFEKAADILGINYEGVIKIEYDETLPGSQIFQYFLRAEEIRSNQHRQLKALWYYANKQPLLKEALIIMLVQMGSDEKELSKNLTYFQEQLLRLQQNAFLEGSPLLEIIHTFRADINRSVTCIRDQHTYRSKQSVSYMKKVMLKMQIITVQKVCVESTARARLYVPAPNGKRKKDAYKYIAARKTTAWFLTDQINCTFKTEQLKAKQNDERKSRAA